MSEKSRRNNGAEGIHAAEFRCRYFRNGRYAGVIKVKELHSATAGLWRPTLAR